jgi:hypothetical protein
VKALREQLSQVRSHLSAEQSVRQVSCHHTAYTPLLRVQVCGGYWTMFSTPSRTGEHQALSANSRPNQQGKVRHSMAHTCAGADWLMDGPSYAARLAVRCARALLGQVQRDSWHISLPSCTAPQGQLLPEFVAWTSPPLAVSAAGAVVFANLS